MKAVASLGVEDVITSYFLLREGQLPAQVFIKLRIGRYLCADKLRDGLCNIFKCHHRRTKSGLEHGRIDGDILDSVLAGIGVAVAFIGQDDDQINHILEVAAIAMRHLIGGVLRTHKPEPCVSS